MESLKTSIQTALFYIKSFHTHNLSLHSNIKSHCVGFGCSDEKQTCFQSEGASIIDEEFHHETCDHCDLIPKLFRVLEGLHFEAEKDIEEVDLAENLFDLKKAEKHIKDYIGFLHRNKMQTSFWKNLMAQNLTHIVFILPTLP